MLTNHMEDIVWEMVCECLKFPFSIVLVRPLQNVLEKVCQSIDILFIYHGSDSEKFLGRVHAWICLHIPFVIASELVDSHVSRCFLFPFFYACILQKNVWT